MSSPIKFDCNPINDLSANAWELLEQSKTGEYVVATQWSIVVIKVRISRNIWAKNVFWQICMSIMYYESQEDQIDTREFLWKNK